jgi:hypothetical protein
VGGGPPFLEPKAVPPIAFTDAQIKHIKTTSYTIPRALCGMYLQRVADLLRGRNFDDGDVFRAGVQAQRECGSLAEDATPGRHVKLIFARLRDVAGLARAAPKGRRDERLTGSAEERSSHSQKR